MITATNFPASGMIGGLSLIRHLDSSGGQLSTIYFVYCSLRTEIGHAPSHTGSVRVFSFPPLVLLFPVELAVLDLLGLVVMDSLRRRGRE